MKWGHVGHGFLPSPGGLGLGDRRVSTSVVRSRPGVRKRGEHRRGKGGQIVVGWVNTRLLVRDPVMSGGAGPKPWPQTTRGTRDEQAYARRANGGWRRRDASPH